MNGEGNAPYIVCAMFTASYAEKANRLAASCAKFSLPYELHEVPTVHRSMSTRGCDDLGFTKANFVHHLLSTHKRPVLYLDADVEFTAQPDLITELVRDRCDFAIYNWLADQYTDRFYPIDHKLGDPRPARARFFRYTGTVDSYSTTQLFCSGATQFYGNSRAARALLSSWHQTLPAFPGSVDDHCLDFTYNNLIKRSWLSWSLKSQWLPKAYARYAFWIYAEPIINHRDFPASVSDFIPIKDPGGRRRYYQSQMEKKKPDYLLPRDCIIDTQEHMLCKLVDGKLVPIGKTPHQFWV
jgi:hypothetical protein